MAASDLNRVYIPATFALLEQLHQDGQLPARSGWGFMVTAALAEFFAGSEEEEIAFHAFDDAALASLRLLAIGDEEKFPHRRVVISVDLPSEQIHPRPDLGDSVVELKPATFSVTDVAAIHVDVAEAEAATAAGIAAVDAADLGDEDAELRVGDALDNLMAYYDPSELPFLVDLL